jgi:hypothetical protein
VLLEKDLGEKLTQAQPFNIYMFEEIVKLGKI